LDAKLLVESIEGPALAPKSHNYVHRRDRGSLGAFGVSDSVVKNRREELLEDTTGLGINETRDALNATLARQPPDRGLGDAFVARGAFVVPPPLAQHLPRPLPLKRWASALGGRCLMPLLNRKFEVDLSRSELLMPVVMRLGAVRRVIFMAGIAWGRG